MAIGEVWKASVVASVDANPEDNVVNVLYFRMKSTADPPTTIEASINTSLIQLYKHFLNQQYALVKTEVRRLSVPPIGADVVPSTAAVGGATGTTQDLKSALVVTLNTATLGRSYRGRLFLPLFNFSYLDMGLWDGTMCASLQTYFDDYVAAVGAAGASADLTWGVWSRKLGDIPPPPGHPVTGYNLTAGFQPITSTRVNRVVATQRRRGYGAHIRD